MNEIQKHEQPRCQSNLSLTNNEINSKPTQMQLKASKTHALHQIESILIIKSNDFFNKMKESN